MARCEELLGGGWERSEWSRLRRKERWKSGSSSSQRGSAKL